MSNINHARFMCLELVRTNAFAKFILGTNFTYSDKPNLEILRDFQSHAFDTEIKFYHQPKRLFRSLIVGYTQNGIIYVNTAAVKTQDQLVGNLMHESSHIIGYKHPFYNTKTRHLSVPYAVGYWAKQEAASYVRS